MRRTEALPAPDAAPRPVSRHRAARTLDSLDRALGRLVGPTAPWTFGSRHVHVVAGWLVGRALVVLLLVRWEHDVALDLQHYHDGLALADGSFDGVMPEYPVPAVALVALPRLLAGSGLLAYSVWFVVLLLALDASFTAVLARRDAPRRAVTLWLVAGPVVGPLLVTRFDLVPGAAVGVAVLLLASRPRVAAALAVAAAALKLWPALLLPALAAPPRSRRAVVVTGTVTATLLVVGTLLLGDLDRALSPLTFQSGRGLQVESLPALPLMLAWSVVHAPWTAGLAVAYSCDEVSGPGAGALLLLSSAAALAVVGVAGVLSLRLWRLGHAVTPAAVGWVALALTGLLVVTNKVFSPQYVLWLLPLAVVLVVLDGGRQSRRTAVALLLVALLGQAIYPFAYPFVSDPSTWNWLGAVLLTVRMVLLVGVVAVTARQAWRLTAPAVQEHAAAAPAARP